MNGNARIGAIEAGNASPAPTLVGTMVNAVDMTELAEHVARYSSRITGCDQVHLVWWLVGANNAHCHPQVVMDEMHHALVNAAFSDASRPAVAEDGSRLASCVAAAEAGGAVLLAELGMHGFDLPLWAKLTEQLRPFVVNALEKERLRFQIARLQHLEERERCLLGISQLANAGQSLLHTVTEVAGIVSGILAVDEAQIALFDAALDTLEYLDGDGSPQELAHPMRREMTEQVIRSNVPVRTGLLGRRQDGAGLAQDHGGGWLGVPIAGDDGLFGVLALQRHPPGCGFSEQDEEFLAFIARQIGQGVGQTLVRQRLESSLAEVEQQLAARNRQLQDQMDAREQIERLLQHEALHDFLTGLPNRGYLCERMARSLAIQTRDPTKTFAVLFMDLDRFKVINDSAGHLVGDALLKEVSVRLAACVRVPDMVARLGGDEFALLIENIAGVDTAVRVAQRVIEALRQPVHVEDKEYFTSASIGIAISDPWYKEAEELLRDADIAMYRAKANEEQRFEIFNERLHLEALETLELEGEIRQAMVREEFEPYFQKIVRLEDGSTTGYESLIRWNHPHRGVLAPGAFLEVAETSGSLEAIDWQMFESTCSVIPQLLLGNEYVNLNFSPRHFRAKDADKRLLEMLAKHGVEPRQVRVEVTEGTLIDNSDHVAQVIERLRDAGVMTALDDFGTGYSSLSYLHRFRLHTVKIDRSFITGLTPGGSGGSEAVVRAILALAQSQGMDVVAEGIETAVQRAALLELGCKYGQGYFFAKPLSLRVLLEARELA